MQLAIAVFMFDDVFSFLLPVFPSNGLRLTNMSVPKIIDYREDMDLDCQFDMGNEELYAVKWYKDDQEFYRYYLLIRYS